VRDSALVVKEQSGAWGDDLVDWQNVFCQSKYTCATHPHVRGSSGRTRIKQEFRRTPARSTTGSRPSGARLRSGSPWSWAERPGSMKPAFWSVFLVVGNPQVPGCLVTLDLCRARESVTGRPQQGGGLAWCFPQFIWTYSSSDPQAPAGKFLRILPAREQAPGSAWTQIARLGVFAASSS
jgi:hypothetical protein